MFTDQKCQPSYRPNLEYSVAGSDAPTAPALKGPVLRLDWIDASEHPETAQYCYEQKAACYSRFGAGAACVPLGERVQRGQLYLITATDRDSGEISGGVSVYVRDGGRPLPVEKAIGHISRFQSEVLRWKGKKVVEFSALWCEAPWRKTGLSERLMLTALSAAQAMGASKVMGFSHQHVLAFHGTVGLIPDYDLGQYAYPSADYASTVVWGDPVDLVTLPAAKRPIVKSHSRALSLGQPVFWRGFAHCMANC